MTSTSFSSLFRSSKFAALVPNQVVTTLPQCKSSATRQWGLKYSLPEKSSFISITKHDDSSSGYMTHESGWDRVTRIERWKELFKAPDLDESLFNDLLHAFHPSGSTSTVKTFSNGQEKTIQLNMDLANLSQQEWVDWVHLAKSKQAEFRTLLRAGKVQPQQWKSFLFGTIDPIKSSVSFSPAPVSLENPPPGLPPPAPAPKSSSENLLSSLSFINTQLVEAAVVTSSTSPASSVSSDKLSSVREKGGHPATYLTRKDIINALSAEERAKENEPYRVAATCLNSYPSSGSPANNTGFVLGIAGFTCLIPTHKLTIGRQSRLAKRAIYPSFRTREEPQMYWVENATYFPDGPEISLVENLKLDERSVNSMSPGVNALFGNNAFGNGQGLARWNKMRGNSPPAQWGQRGQQASSDSTSNNTSSGPVPFMSRLKK